eukprot:5227233-Pyramimonas_sp.AAC.1
MMRRESWHYLPDSHALAVTPPLKPGRTDRSRHCVALLDAGNKRFIEMWRRRGRGQPHDCCVATMAAYLLQQKGGGGGGGGWIVREQSE